MFKNIGSKIKGLAKALFIITSIIAVLAGLFVIVYGVGNIEGDSEEKIIAIIAGVAIIFGGIIMAWLQNFLLYGYGELIDSNQKILKILEEKNKKTSG